MLSLCQSARRRQWLYRRSARQEPSAAPDVEATCRAGRGPGLLRNDILPKLEFGLRPLSDLSLPKRNVRALTQAPIREVAASIGPSASTCPVLINPNGEVIDGAVRVEAAKLVGLS
jgi:hypothetical protein